jgi:hypothetical protein
MLKIALFTILLTTSCCGHAALDLIPDTTSPDKHLAFAVDWSRDRVWLVHLPSLLPIGDSLEDFVGLPGHGGAEWNLRAKRVALFQGAVPYGRTRVFEYSKDSLRELPLPNLESLPRRWSPSAAAVMKQSHVYVTPVRWRGLDAFELAVQGTMWAERKSRANASGSTKSVDFDFTVLVKFNRDGDSKIVNVKERA